MSVYMEIPKGAYGEFSKVEEEFLELKEALIIGNRIHIGIELSDLLGAINGLTEKMGYTWQEIAGFAQLKGAWYAKQLREKNGIL